MTELDDAAALRAAARELAEAAEEIRAASVHATAALTDVGRTLRRAPGPGLRAQRAVLRAVTNRRGLGYALAGGPVGTLGGKLGEVVRAESLAVRVMTTSLRLRIAAVALTEPDLAADPMLRRLNDAVAAAREVEAARALVALVRDRGAARTLTALAPVFSEVLALRALLDRNPLNDRTAWLIATGAATATADPVTGLSNRAVAALDRGEGAARRTEPSAREAALLASSGSLLAFLGNIAVIGPTGRVLVQAVAGPDGAARFVVQVPGMRLGRPDDVSPADLLGAFSSTVLDSAPYSRALAKAIDDFGMPDGAEIALVGHSAGGAAVLSLAQDRAFCARRTVTHIVAVGSPVDFKTPADPRTWVASITNRHDLIPSLDGQGAGSCFDLHPDWYVVDYGDPSDVFPACHSIEHYTADLAERLPEARAAIDARLAPYRGPVTRTGLYQLYDREPAPTPRPAPRGPARSGSGTPARPGADGSVPTAQPDTTGLVPSPRPGTGPVPTAGAAARGLVPPAQGAGSGGALGGRVVAVAGGGVELPVRCEDGFAFTAYFAAEAGAAGRVLGGAGRVVTVGGRALVAVHAYDHRRTSLGRYLEVDVGVVVRDPRVERFATCFLASLVSTDLACAVAREVFGLPADTGDVRVEGGARRVRAEADAADGAVLTFTGALGPGVPVAARDLVVHALRDRALVRACVERRGRRVAHPAPSARLTVGPSAHPLARHLRDLGLDGARPLLCVVSPAHRSLRDTPA
ncbi:acetoacetate decarboxylase family protein [Actinomadura atramentaria]|uniref:acetoacetate decarboxylase family protein n=1 Tax=Actinomadura atramentaria TaxID=1990 RepID=UPI0003A830A5|nr:acetoacetate decarboxylase family protein [Actinomadura atramentaria]